MENKETQENLIKAVKNETLYEIASEPEIINSIDADTMGAIKVIVKDNPQFKDMTFTQLDESKEFQQKLKEYRLNSPLPKKAGTMEVLKSVIPKNHVKANNKLANKITKKIVDEGEFSLVVSGRKAKKEVFTKVMLAYDNRYINLSGQPYTPYDREVYDGVVTLYVAGNNVVTPIMVYRAMNGLTESEYVKPETLEAVTKSLDKSRYMQVTIDYTEEAKLYNKKIQKTTYQGYLLASTKITVKINGQEHEAYKLLDKPILYEYAQISGQIITVPNKLLQTKGAVRGTDEVIIIRGYLLRQIEWLKSDVTERSDNITYHGIYDELEVSRIILEEVPYKKKTAKVRNHVKAILDEWVELKYITKHKEYKDGKTLMGVTITI
jgi:hypothetical protein